MDLEIFKNKIKNIHKLVAFDHIIEGYGFKNEKELFKSDWLNKEFKQHLKNDLKNKKQEIKEVCDFIDENLTKEQAKEMLKLISPHQFKFSEFRAKHNLQINIFVETKYINYMEKFSDELFFSNELMILKKIQNKADEQIICSMSHEEIFEQYQHISTIMNPNPIVTLEFEQTKSLKKKKNK